VRCAAKAEHGEVAWQHLVGKQLEESWQDLAPCRAYEAPKIGIATGGGLRCSVRSRWFVPDCWWSTLSTIRTPQTTCRCSG
jgi:hypothetical protein